MIRDCGLDRDGALHARFTPIGYRNCVSADASRC